MDFIREIAEYAAIRRWEDLMEFQRTGRKEWPELTIIASDSIPRDRILFMYGPECVGQIKGVTADE